MVSTLAFQAGSTGSNPVGATMVIDNTVQTTSYCLHGRMADGSYTRPRSAASNQLRLGTKIRLVGKITGPEGMRKYVIRDRIGYGTELDLWVDSCHTASTFGRRTVHFKMEWTK